MKINFNRPLKLNCPVQNYPWGKLGDCSLVARMAGLKDATRSFAELWMGAHPSAPALVEIDGKTFPLNQLIDQYPSEILGENCIKHFGPMLPFLFKILSVRTALSIQAHPNKQLAAKLHAVNPKNYPDANHKPEIAIALTEVEALHGFRKFSEIVNHGERLPSLKEMFDLHVADSKSNDEENIRRVFSKLLSTKREIIAAAAKSLVTDIKQLSERLPEDEWVLKLYPEFPDDPGLFCFYLLRYRKLLPGECLYSAPGIIHAYISGDMVECMANSDNVVRGGLTGKFCDVEVLLNLVDYRQEQISNVVVCKNSDGSKTFQASAEEFRLSYFCEPGNYQVDTSGGPSILSCLKGSALLRSDHVDLEIHFGDVILVPAVCRATLLVKEAAQIFSATIGGEKNSYRNC